METAPKQIVIVQSPKSTGLVAVLGLFFGPLGLVYVGLKPALIALVIVVPVVIFTLGFGLFVTAPSCAFVGYKLAEKYNKNLLAGSAT